MSDTSDVETAATTMTDVPLEKVVGSSSGKIGSADKKQLERKRRLRIAAVVVALCATIGLVVGLSVTLTSSSNKNSPATGVEDTPPIVEFPNSKSLMDYICSEESIADIDGFNQCREACQPAFDCCDPYKNTERSSSSSTCSLQDELEGCVNYAKCQSVMDYKVDPAPPNLSDICSPEALAESKMDCRLACQDVECCYSDESSSIDSCVTSQFLTCLDYAPCQNLRNATDILPVAPPKLDEVCALNKTDNEECKELCEPAKCCLPHVLGDGDDGDDEEVCMKSDFISCLTYAPCGGLLIPPIHNEVEEAPDTIAELCTLENLLGDGYDACAEACSAGSCCYSTALDDNCFLSDPLGCIEYAQCGLLQLTGGSIPRAPKNLKDLCSWDQLQQKQEDNNGQQSAAACAEACNPASCCLGIDADDNTCVDEGNFFTCAEYYPCTVLYITGGGLSNPPDTIRQDCSSDRVDLDDGVSCAASCSDAQCCFSVEDSCLLGNADKCISYMHSGCWRVPGWLNFDPPF